MSIKYIEIENPYKHTGNESYNKYLGICTRVLPSVELLAELPLPKNMLFQPCTLSKGLSAEIFEEGFNFNVRADDTFVVSIPKCGSSWLQNIVWLLKNNLDFATDQSVDRFDRMRDFDFNMKGENRIYNLDWYRTLKSPRVMKTHLPIQFLPKKIWTNKTKVIYITRNPYDTAVSLCHFMRNYFQYIFSMDEVVDLLINDYIISCPFFDHVLNFWQLRHMENILFITYEDLVNNSFETIKGISEFLDCNYSDDQLTELTEYVSFNNMCRNSAVNREMDVLTMEKHLGKNRPDPQYRYVLNSSMN